MLSILLAIAGLALVASIYRYSSDRQQWHHRQQLREIGVGKPFLF